MRVAATNRRRINSEVIICIEQSVRSRNVELEDLLKRARRLRLLTRDQALAPADLDDAKRAGR